MVCNKCKDNNRDDFNENKMFQELEQELTDNKANREVKEYAKRLSIYYNTLLEEDNINEQLAQDLLLQYQDLMLGGSTFI